MNIKKAIETLTELPSVSGYEHLLHDRIFSLCEGVFDTAYALKNQSVVAVKKCGNPNAPVILLNAHLDEIGMYVTAVHEGGFLSVTNIGGIDTNILYASQVTVYGKRPIKGVFVSTPPHLGNGSTDLDKITKLVIDTGLTKKELDELVDIGTPAVLANGVDYLLNDRISSRGLDDKIGVITIIKAVEMLKKTIDFDIYALFSSQEEVTSLGASTGVYDINPDMAIVVDVGHAKMKGIDEIGALELSCGTAVSYSATTSRKLSDAICTTAEKHKLKFRRVSEANNTGTDAHNIQVALEGIPCTVLSVPLRNMHTACEVISLEDVKNTSKLIACFITDGLYRGEEMRIIG
ncbi:MAG: M20/M25/M40 family metallo-hydrolase [Ruminococcaceae bacterium]|nr:M20/M25/M40 family metallo-hydrolase [Oscillospiraceae bacterium]